MLNLNQISFKYENNEDLILDDVSLELNEGEILAIVGPSGGGKSTLLRVLSGLEHPMKGEIVINNKEVTYEKPEKRAIGMLFQDYALFPHMTVEKNIAYGLNGAKKDRVNEMLKLVDLEGYNKRYPHELSGGQQQRVALARAIAPSPHILLLDEPFSNLDTELLTKIRDELFGIIKSMNITTIMVTHNEEDALHSDKIIRIESGQVKETKVL